MPNILLDTLPFTEEGAKLVLTEEQERDCKLIYKLNEHGDALFDGFWSPEKEYSDDYIIIPLRSVYGGVTPIQPVNTEFANVIGSSKDPCPYESWIELLRNQLGAGNVNTCCTDTNIYTAPGVIGRAGVCGGRIVGGHVIWGRETDTAQPNRTVFLLPICSNHNVMTPRQPRVVSFMMLGRAMSAVQLDHYLRCDEIQRALQLKSTSSSD